MAEMTRAARPFGLAAYRFLTIVLSPAIRLLLRARLARGKEDTNRIAERLGAPSRARPDGVLVWVHGASVGECLAALPLVGRLLENGERHILVTSGTMTSARLMAKRLPARAFHQFVPVDVPRAVGAFLDHWRPDAALFVESELWPNLLLETKARGIPIALVNARLSERSFAGWHWFAKSARMLLSSFDVALAEDEAAERRLTALGASRVRVTGNLKADAAPLPADDVMLHALRTAVAGRPVFLTASSHPGEEEILLDADALLREAHPGLLTVIVPRHPERGPEIEQLARTRGRTVLSRSASPLPTADTQVYVADTLGELGLFYRLATFAFLGGSLVPHGGQNPLEPAHLFRAVLTGPHIHNFTKSYVALFAAQGEGRVNSAEDLARAASRLLSDPAHATRLGMAANHAATELGGALKRTHEAVEDLLRSHARA